MRFSQFSFCFACKIVKSHGNFTIGPSLCQQEGRIYAANIKSSAEAELFNWAVGNQVICTTLVLTYSALVPEMTAIRAVRFSMRWNPVTTMENILL